MLFFPETGVPEAGLSMTRSSHWSPRQRLAPAHARIELGSEPPLSADGNQGLDRRKVSLRWLAGTVLTAATSSFLMGGAFFVAMQGHVGLAAIPAPGTQVGAVAPGAPVAVTKGDRIRHHAAPVASRVVMHLSTVTRDGDRDKVRTQPFVRVSSALALTRNRQTVESIPEFNPLRIFSDTNVFSTSQTSDNPSFYGAEVEGEVTLVERDFPKDDALFDPEIAMTSAEVEAVIRNQAGFLTDGAVQVAAVPVIDPARIELGFAAAADPLAAFAPVRVEAENVSTFARSFAAFDQVTGAGLATDPAQVDGGSGLDEKIVTVGKNDTFVNLLKASNATDAQARAIIDVFRKNAAWKGLDVGWRVRIGTAKIEATDDKPRPVRVSVYTEKGHLQTVALDDANNYVTATEPDLVDFGPAEEAEPELNIADFSPNRAPTLYEALYQTALENQIPRSAIQDLVGIYTFDVDFNARVRPGDSFEVFYGLEDETNPNSVTEILFASINVRGEEKRFYRFRAPDDGTVDFYDAEGKSAKKFLMRKPMEGGTFRSGFGGRRHPVLGYYRMHTGVDWAASTGTPIVAAGNGVIEKLGWQSGYGRYIRIQHSNGYETAYAHMSNWARGLQEGSRVRQGQVIGYVGSSGLSTGPHLHYEVLINETHVDPMRIRLPRGRELNGRLLADFQRERKRIDALLATNRPARVAAQSN
jgi:murein DD-endopeptidase MepM/ murein hydrolase activator NlpD